MPIYLGINTSIPHWRRSFPAWQIKKRHQPQRPGLVVGNQSDDADLLRRARLSPSQQARPACTAQKLPRF